MVKVAVVVPSFSRVLPSDPECIARGLAEAGAEVHVYTTRSSSGRDADYLGLPVRDLRDSPFEIHWCRHLGVVRQFVVSLPPSPPLDSSFQGAIIFEDYPMLSRQAARQLAHASVPVVLAVERCYYPSDRLARSALGFVDRALAPRLWRRAEAIACHSRESMRFYTNLGAPRERLAYLPGCIDAEYFRRESALANGHVRTARDPPTIVCVARLHPYKGIPVLLEAAAGLRARGRDFRLRIIGRGPMEAEYRGLATRLGLGAWVSFEPTPIPNPAMPAVLGAADIYVQPSLIEPFGRAAAEAMASRLPVVASAVGGLRDTVSDGETGALVAPGDAGGLARALETLAEDPELARRMGRSGQARAIERLDYRRVARWYLDRFSGRGPRAPGLAS